MHTHISLLRCILVTNGMAYVSYIPHFKKKSRVYHSDNDQSKVIAKRSKMAILTHHVIILFYIKQLNNKLHYTIQKNSEYFFNK